MKLEVLLSFCSQRYQQQGQAATYDQDINESELDQLNEQLKQFGKVLWFFAETDSLLDESSVKHPSSDAANNINPPLYGIYEGPQQRTEWERVWQDFFGLLQYEDD